MSRIGKKPIDLPSTVKVAISGQEVKVEGPKGKVAFTAHPLMVVKLDGSQVSVERPNEGREARSLHGLTRTLIANMVEGVSNGYSKTLEVKGVGYRADVKGKTVNLALGFSHPVNYSLPEGVTAKVEDKTKIVLESIDKQLLGATAAKIRSFRPPEPYGGKGVRYSDEVVRRKEGKSGAK
jgi:large subunit ribosomal protein L6